jgi:hypothetical protein
MRYEPDRVTWRPLAVPDVELADSRGMSSTSSSSRVELARPFRGRNAARSCRATSSSPSKRIISSTPSSSSAAQSGSSPRPISSTSSSSSAAVGFDEDSVGTCCCEELLRPLPRRRGERPGRSIEPVLYSSSTLASRPRTRDLRASISVAVGGSAGVVLILLGAVAAAGWVVGSLFSFLGLRRAVLFDVSFAAFCDVFGLGAGVLVFASFSFSRRIPPAEPARPTLAFCVVAFRDLACFESELLVRFGPDEDVLDAMILVTGVEVVSRPL